MLSVPEHQTSMEISTVPSIVFTLLFSVLMVQAKRIIQDVKSAPSWSILISKLGLPLFALAALIVGGISTSSRASIVLDQRTLVLLSLFSAVILERFYGSDNGGKGKEAPTEKPGLIFQPSIMDEQQSNNVKDLATQSASGTITKEADWPNYQTTYGLRSLEAHLLTHNAAMPKV